MSTPAPGADALHALTHAMLPDAAHDDGVLPRAATVVIVRDGRDGVEILMLRRPERGSFGGAWVFPGGKVDPTDAAADATLQSELVNAAIRETKEETNYVVASSDLTLLSLWEPPRNIPARIRTWFFVATNYAGDFFAQPSEVEEDAWITAQAMLARHAAGEATLYPPTFVTLQTLAPFTTVAELAGALSSMPLQEYRTTVRPLDGVPVFRWHGDFEYDRDRPGESGPRHRIVAGALPWTYVRDSDVP